MLEVERESYIENNTKTSIDLPERERENYASSMTERESITHQAEQRKIGRARITQQALH